MPELDELRDARLRAALGELHDRARSALRPPGPDRIPALARRRRFAAVGAGSALLLALAGAFWLAGAAPAAHQPAARVCTPVQARAFLRPDATPSQTEDLRAAIAASPEISDYGFESREEAYERFKRQFVDAPELVAATQVDDLPSNFWFDLPCAADFPAVQARLKPLASDVTCPCVPDPEADRSVQPADSPSTSQSPRR
ncbi:hypothetical protein Dvina_10770 [Dactylosporangium vinaceum]|uniref:Permease-like cell division protein FtsX n=1 Tax=Dactylosporangium vinaceum TaxID=53362 RepID=A0ABV5MBR0_9ACTN|nr:permease-like cell division protein FtsX [Dactylosporangium vinaceum]UAB98521.1 hypothetical protein Dvina_10770 [Dactylosporangium vinaceum]